MLYQQARKKAASS